MDQQKLEREVNFKAVRSRGPGGQNVNRVSSAAQLTWDVQNSQLFSWEQKNRIQTKLMNMINSEGLLYMRCDEFRDLERNKSRCIEKLLDCIAGALHVPKKRKATKPSKTAKAKRRDEKSRRGNVKKLRGRVDF